MIVNPTEYIKACKTGGECNNPFPQWPQGKRYSAAAFVDGTNGNENNIANQIRFKACVGCGLPFNQAEATRLNSEIGFELPSPSESLARLKAMKERLRRNDGQSR